MILLDFGELALKEKVKYCPICKKTFRSEELKMLVPDYSNFGFDVIEFVGRKLFIDYYTEREVLSALNERNVKISLRQISFLGKKFILYLAQAHKSKETEIKGLIQKNGGYIVHLDGTCDGASPHFFCAVEELLKLVLLSRKIPSESIDSIVPILQELFAAYGQPIAFVCDMSKAIIGAIERIFPGVPIFICHFHFLRDLGKDLLKKDYDLLASMLRAFNVKPTLSKFARELRDLIKNFTSLSQHLETKTIDLLDKDIPEQVLAHLLVEWIQNYKTDLAGYGFPFDRAHLAQLKRMEEAFNYLQKLELAPSDRLTKIKEFLEEVLSDSELQSCLEKLKKKTLHFDRVREIMRLAPLEGKDGLNDDGGEVDMPKMKRKLEEFIEIEEIQEVKLVDSGYKKMIAQIDKYKDRLFTNGVEIIDSKGNKSHMQPERTNNLLERFFRGEKRGIRKRTGNKSMSRALKAMLAETPYVKNLSNHDYMKVILNGKKTLAESFADIDSKQVRIAIQKHHEEQDKLRPCVKRAIGDDNLLQSIFDAYSSRTLV